jgi:hypothetical protein
VKRDCPSLPDPTQWILNQASMRATWEKFFHNTYKKSEPIRSMILRNPYCKYMRFMYDSYPPGFGDEIIKAYQEGRQFDGLQVYQQLTNKKN